jgi:hypothetical protein
MKGNGVGPDSAFTAPASKTAPLGLLALGSRGVSIWRREESTQRYIHPEADAIGRVSAAALPKVGTKLGTARNKSKGESAQSKQAEGAKGGVNNGLVVPGGGIEPPQSFRTCGF